MMSGVMKMALSRVRMVSSGLIVIFVVMAGRLTMVTSRMLIMLCGLAMMLCGLFRHGNSLYFHFVWMTDENERLKKTVVCTAKVKPTRAESREQYSGSLKIIC
jgi:hypothetical protein